MIGQPHATMRPLVLAWVTAVQRVLATPSSFLVSIGIYVSVVVILGSLWRVATAANGGEVAGYTAVALTWYVATSEAATIPLNTRLIDQLGDDISSGAVAVELLRPTSMVALRIAAELGRATPHLVACMVVGTALATLGGGAAPSLPGLLLAAPALVLAIACNIVGQHAFAGVAFWIRDTRSSWFVYQKLVFIIGGMLLPLEVLPDTVGGVAKLLPFMVMAYAPARLASGHVEPWLLAVQVGWIVVLATVTAAVYRRGERRLQVVGG